MAAPRIRIKLRAYDHEILDAAARDIVDHVTRTGAKVVGPVPLPTERALYTVVRSPHKDKDIRGTKLGMTQIFTDDARAVPVTVIQAGPCLVTQVKTTDRDGYEAVQLAFGEARKGKSNKPTAGHFDGAGLKRPMLH